jgi:hypothetical protein
VLSAGGSGEEGSRRRAQTSEYAFIKALTIHSLFGKGEKRYGRYHKIASDRPKKRLGLAGLRIDVTFAIQQF